MTSDASLLNGPAGDTASFRCHVGTDVGGTFTDLWAIAADGRQIVVKAPSTPDIVSGVLDAISMAATQFGVTDEAFCAGVQRFGHGTTAGLNALLTGTAARTALITTQGFRDTLEIGRMKRQVSGLTDVEIGDYTNRGRTPPVVPRALAFEVVERVDREGRIVNPLDETSVLAAIARIRRAAVEAVAVCLLWSVANGAHERRVGELLTERLPGVFVSLSHEIAPSVGEYARTSTTAINAALGPVMGAYLSRLAGALRDRGLCVPIQVMTGAGGVVQSDELAREPVAAMMSGPAAGVIACQQLGRQLGIDRLLTIDVGGTSFDVGTVVDGEPLTRGQVTIAGGDIQRPSIDVGTIGAGGGSIARVEHGVVLVGPQSAGAVPGPVCYGRGGRQVTATDADLLLGVLDEAGFAGGTMGLDRAAAGQAMHDQIAGPMGVSTIEAAWGIRQVLDSKMSDLLRSVTIERGYDPREFVMFANGGQGPSHAWALCRELGIRTFLVTPTATAQSALGTGTSDLRQSAERPCYLRIPPGRTAAEEDFDRLTQALGVAQEAARGHVLRGLSVAGSGGSSVEWTIALRYRGQAHHLEVPTPAAEVDRASFDKLVERFEAQYEALFGAGSAFREAGLEVLSVRAAITVPLRSSARPTSRDPLVAAGSRAVVFDDPAAPVDCLVWTTAFPAAGQHVEGPALVSYPGQTLVIPPGAVGSTDALGNVTVSLDGRPSKLRATA